jgi:NAD(P)-dependent dehydrogenase (short-subunit alcohol dehydrogenase family)
VSDGGNGKISRESSGLQGSKAAVAIMTESLAMEVNPFGVSVTSVIPGYVKSDILQNSLTETERWVRKFATLRFGCPLETFCSN